MTRYCKESPKVSVYSTSEALSLNSKRKNYAICFFISLTSECYLTLNKVHSRKIHEGPDELDVQLYSFFNLGLRSGGWLTPRPRRLTPGQETQYLLYRRLCGPQVQSRRERVNINPFAIRSPDRPTRSESLYRLRYSCPHLTHNVALLLYDLFRCTCTIFRGYF